MRFHSALTFVSIATFLFACGGNPPPPATTETAAAPTGSATTPADPDYKADLTMICSAPSQAPGASNPQIAESDRSAIEAEWIGKHLKTERAKKLFTDSTSAEAARKRIREEMAAQGITSCAFTDAWK